jgi:hypothetical protein
VDSVFGGVVVEGERLVEVVGDLRDGLGKLGAEQLDEDLHRGQGVGLVLAAPDLSEAFFAAGCADLGSAASTFADL